MREGAARVDAAALDDQRDHTLWAAAADGDPDAFTALYHRHADAVWRHAYRLTGTRTAAEDVLAATFLTAWRRRAQVRFAADSARPWRPAVAGNEACPELHRVRDALEGLSERYREVVELRMIAEVPQPDAARALGIPEATLRSRIHRARAKLRDLLVEEGQR